MTELEKGRKHIFLPQNAASFMSRAAFAAFVFAACTHPRSGASREGSANQASTEVHPQAAADSAGAHAPTSDAAEADRQIQRLLDSPGDHRLRLLREQTLEWLLAHPEESYLKILARVDVEAPPAMAIYALPRFGRDDSVPVLERVLRHADDPTALLAARALGEHSSPEAFAALERALHDSRAPVVTSAAAGLARRGDRAACPLLAGALERASPGARAGVADASKRLGCDSP